MIEDSISPEVVRLDAQVLGIWKLLQLTGAGRDGKHVLCVHCHLKCINNQPMRDNFE